MASCLVVRQECTSTICFVFLFCVGSGGLLLGVLSEGKLKRCPFVKCGLEINSSHCSEGTPTGTKAQLWSCNLSFLPCVPNYSRGLLLLEVFLLLGLLPCLALNTLALETHLFHQPLLRKDFIGSICLSKLLILFCFLFRDFICKTGMRVCKIRWLKWLKCQGAERQLSRRGHWAKQTAYVPDIRLDCSHICGNKMINYIKVPVS